MSLTKARLLSVERKRVEVPVPELDGVVTLQTPTAGEWLDYQRWLSGLPEGSLDHVTRIVALTAIDDDGKPLLTDEDCREMPHDVLVRLSRAAFDLTRPTDEGVAVAKGES